MDKFLTHHSQTDTNTASEEDIEVNQNQSTKKKKYEVKYRENWEDDFPLWLSKCSYNKAFCKVCQRKLEGGKKHLKRHSSTAIHLRNMKKIKGAVNIQDAIAKSHSLDHKYAVKEAELKLTMFLVEHNLSFNIASHLPQLVKSACPDSTIASDIKCSRTKATELVTDKIYPYMQKQLVAILKKNFFSIIVDETTDISTTKCLVIAIRFYDEEKKKSKDCFLSLLEVDNGTADGIFKCICNLFEKLQVPLSQIIGFASDSASVMVGDLNGVSTKLKRILPNLFVIKCMAHSLHLCASKACSRLPEDIEKLAKDIHNYFAHSAKRKKEFIEFQHFTDVSPHTLLRPSQTRWLSLQLVVDRIVEQWPALTLFFQSECFITNVPEGQIILTNLRNPIFKIYFLFLSDILAVITKMNREFQSESPQINMLLSNISINYKMILKFYIKPNVVNNTPLHILDPKNPHYFLNLENVYLGHKVENYLLNITVSQGDMEQVRTRCLDFYVTLSSQIKSRIDFNDEFLRNLNIINPENVFDDKEGRGSITPISQRFHHVLTARELENIALEWRMLPEIKPEIHIANIEELIIYLSNKFDGSGHLLFKNFIKLLKIIVSLPHSSAAAERFFSTLTLIKTKYRNLLNIETINGLMMCKCITECFKWIPPKELVQQCY